MRVIDTGKSEPRLPSGLGTFAAAQDPDCALDAAEGPGDDQAGSDRGELTWWSHRGHTWLNLRQDAGWDDVTGSRLDGDVEQFLKGTGRGVLFLNWEHSVHACRNKVGLMCGIRIWRLGESEGTKEQLQRVFPPF